MYNTQLFMIGLVLETEDGTKGTITGVCLLTYECLYIQLKCDDFAKMHAVMMY